MSLSVCLFIYSNVFDSLLVFIDPSICEGSICCSYQVLDILLYKTKEEKRNYSGQTYNGRILNTLDTNWEKKIQSWDYRHKKAKI